MLIINFLVKFIYFDPLLSPCAWLVKWHKYIIANYTIMVLQRSCIFSVIAEPVCRKLPQLFWLCFVWYIWHCFYELWFAKLFYNCYFMWTQINWLWVAVKAVTLSVQLIVATCKHVQNINMIVKWLFQDHLSIDFFSRPFINLLLSWPLGSFNTIYQLISFRTIRFFQDHLLMELFQDHLLVYFFQDHWLFQDHSSIGFF